MGQWDGLFSLYVLILYDNGSSGFNIEYCSEDT